MGLTQSFLDGRVVLHPGDCLDVLKTLPDNSVDSVVTDPPYHLVSIVKRFGAANAAEAQEGSDGAFKRASKGFMGKEWDGGDIAFQAALWAEVLRVLKPGGYLLAFSATRTYHRMTCAIEDGGFDVRDQIGWLYAVGMVKNHNLVKAAQRAGYDASQMEGKGTALAPAWEPICVARKPIEGSNVQNILRWGTGGLNINDCRIEAEIVTGWDGTGAGAGETWNNETCGLRRGGDANPTEGRWPKNVIIDGSPEVIACFPGTGESSAARFFFSAKANEKDRAGSLHPTVKPVSLMRYLVRLVAPPGGTTLDIFAGSGTTGEAAYHEGLNAILIERDPEYQTDIARRLSNCTPEAKVKQSLLKDIGQINIFDILGDVA